MITLAGMAVTIVCQWPGSQVVLSPDSHNNRQELRFHNAETFGNEPHGQKTCAISTPYGPMYVIWDHTTNAPDVINVVPPPGYYADKPEIIIEENSGASVWLYPELMS